MDDGRPTDSDVLWAARQVVWQHTAPREPGRATGSCPHCTPDGCHLLEWATAKLERGRST